MNKVITNARLIDYENLQTITIENNLITAIKQTNYDDKGHLDLQGDYLSLGGLDLQINGALALAFPDLTLEDINKLDEICDYLWQEGIDQFLPTIVTTSITKIHLCLKVINEYINLPKKHSQAEIIGVHLEGPFLNYDKRGAHPAQYLLPLTLDNMKKVLGEYAHVVKIITLAPELDTTGQIIPFLHSQGIIVSLGHSLATEKQAQDAFKQGASMVTHAFNAMPNLHHRQCGLLGEAIINSDVYCGLIADGNHVCETMLKLILKASNYQQGIFLVSDALSPMGLPDGFYPWDERIIEVKNGTARLEDGTLSGTTLSLFVGAQNLVKWGICDVTQAIALVTDAPRKALKIPTLQVGMEANFIRWQWHNQELTWHRIN